MNTPAHVVLSCLALGRPEKPSLLVPIAIGAALPDLPMVGFYAYQKLVLHSSEAYIWNEAYFQDGWQAFFDVFNSVPLVLLLLLFARLAKAEWLTALFASMALHAVGDLPFHHNDGHRHFFPFSDWRFESPISYWDPNHFGNIFAPLEIAFALAGSAYILYRYRSKTVRILAGLVFATYTLYIGYVFAVWI